MSILQKTSNLDRAKDDAQRQSSKTARSGRNDPLARRGEEESSIGWQSPHDSSRKNPDCRLGLAGLGTTRYA